MNNRSKKGTSERKTETWTKRVYGFLKNTAKIWWDLYPMRLFIAVYRRVYLCLQTFSQRCEYFQHDTRYNFPAAPSRLYCHVTSASSHHFVY